MATRKSKSVADKVVGAVRKPRAKKLRNHFVFVLDDSGSMRTIATAAKEQFNRMINKTAEEARVTGQKTLVSRITFGDRVTVDYSHQPADNLQSLTYFNPRQPSTKLFSGVKRAVEVLDEVMPLKTYDDAFVVIVVTDGEENSSSAEDIRAAKVLMTEKQGQDNWTFVFLVPHGSKNRLVANYSIPAGNVQEWDQTEQGMEFAAVETCTGTQNFYAARSMGLKKSEAYFVQPDLGSVNTRQLNAKLNDVTGQCDVHTVAVESRIGPFVESKTGRAYVPGTAFYQLMKTEKAVSPTKKVMIMDKKTGKVYGGQQARDLIGLPNGVTAKVEPGNHSKYDIFIQSKVSFGNRILPRGTKVLVLKPGALV